jgi:hypothetical protein
MAITESVRFAGRRSARTAPNADSGRLSRVAGPRLPAHISSVPAVLSYLTLVELVPTMGQADIAISR